MASSKRRVAASASATPSATSGPPRFQNVRSSTYARRRTSASASRVASSHGTSMTRRINTASAHPGRMPLVGAQGAPSAPSTRRWRSAAYADCAGPASHPGTPALRIATSTA
eukprot:8224547-Lingulodinium_polyedra.AAC.1